MYCMQIETKMNVQLCLQNLQITVPFSGTCQGICWALYWLAKVTKVTCSHVAPHLGQQLYYFTCAKVTSFHVPFCLGQQFYQTIMNSSTYVCVTMHYCWGSSPSNSDKWVVLLLSDEWVAICYSKPIFFQHPCFL